VISWIVSIGSQYLGILKSIPNQPFGLPEICDYI